MPLSLSLFLGGTLDSIRKSQSSGVSPICTSFFGNAVIFGLVHLTRIKSIFRWLGFRVVLWFLSGCPTVSPSFLPLIAMYWAWAQLISSPVPPLLAALISQKLGCSQSLPHSHLLDGGDRHTYTGHPTGQYDAAYLMVSI